FAKFLPEVKWRLSGRGRNSAPTHAYHWVRRSVAGSHALCHWSALLNLPEFRPRRGSARSRKGLLTPLNCITEVRETMRREWFPASAVIISSVMPSAKYSCAGSPERLVKGRTPMEWMGPIWLLEKRRVAQTAKIEGNHYPGEYSEAEGECGFPLPGFVLPKGNN